VRASRILVAREHDVVERQHEIGKREVVVREHGQPLEPATVVVRPVAHRTARERHAELARTLGLALARAQAAERIHGAVGIAAERRERLGAEEAPARSAHRRARVGERGAERERAREVAQREQGIARGEDLDGESW